MTDRRQAVAIPIEPGWADIREGVRRICEQYPNSYWVALDHESAYPREFEFVRPLSCQPSAQTVMADYPPTPQ